MPAVNLKDHGDAQLEAGLLRTQEEEKIPFISPGLDQTRTGLAPCQLETSPDSGKMSSRKRLVMILMLSVVIGFGLALAKDPSLPSSCLGWARGNDHFHTKTARSFLGKRADASVTNATTPGQTSEQGGSGARSEQSTTNPPVTTTSPKDETTTSTPPPSTTSHTSTSTPTSIQETSTSSPSPSTHTTPATSTTPSSTPTSTSTTSRTPESTSSEKTTATTAESTTSKIQKTITTGRIATTSPVAQTLTTTLPDGGTLTITSTSWVAIVPTDKSSSSSGPQLQNAASKSHGHVMLALTLGALAVGMVFI
ncbi:hypothetical protein VFPPC_05978 [Pochonia chlamydosporia 170]|uniref:Uncharacterized protein n=1 Tax=Pochonia chlamydosporia 170 TaxID=1380566 RepID=A0A179FGM5_METCM|nr:hypothetical protein VFPPC_05978 [Pochonia chlamydosporia 170]OAQ64745.1 hypothetical protein VFPPC_05978 [Pochonia chlamydosporia 170]